MAKWLAPYHRGDLSLGVWASSFLGWFGVVSLVSVLSKGEAVASVMPAMLFGFPWALLFSFVVVRMILRRILRRPLDRQMAFKWGVGVGILAVLFLHLPMAFVSLISQFGVEVENGSKPDAVFHWLKPILSVAALFLISFYLPAELVSEGAMFLWWGIFLVYCGFCGIFVRAFIGMGEDEKFGRMVSQEGDAEIRAGWDPPKLFKGQ